MNSFQRFLVIGALVAIALVLAFVFLSWGNGAFSSMGGDRIAIVVLSHDPENIFGNGYGLYTTQGIAGVILGLVAPLFLVACAAFVALGVKTPD